MEPTELTTLELKQQYLRKAIDEYEYSRAAEYEKQSMTSRAVEYGTLDFDYDKPEKDVDLSSTTTGVNGAWVNARVWVPKEWLESNRLPSERAR
jgi:hypothetical protein